MKLFKNVKKGFTLVELVVVIAVVAILAAVSVIAYTSITKKAKQSNDQIRVDQVNLTLKADQTLNGKQKSVHEALTCLQQEGFSPENLKEQSEGWRFAYCYSENKLCLLENNKVVYPEGMATPSDKTDLWLFEDNGGDLRDEYSHYLRNSNITGEVKVYGGLDVGNNAGVDSILYDRTADPMKDIARNVIIRSSGGTVTLNAPKDTVRHYGDANLVVIDALATSSYHEFGNVLNAQIKTGRVVLESEEASIDSLLLIAKDDKSGFDAIILETKEGASMPNFDRTDVNIDPNGTLVVNVVTPTSDEYIYLTKAGVIEQVVVTNEEVDTKITNVNNADTAKSASETSAQTFSISEQVANVGIKNEDGKYVDSENNPIELSSLETVDQIQTVAKADLEDIEAGQQYFAGGAGTNTTPYIISNATELSNMRNALSGNYMLIKDIDMSGVTSWSPIGASNNPFTGKFDGRGYSIKNWNTSTSLFGYITGHENAKLTGELSDVLDENYNLVEANVAEENYLTVIKDLNFVDCTIYVNQPEFGVLANEVDYAYVSNIEFRNNSIVFDSSYRSGSMIGVLYGSHIRNLHLDASNNITCAACPSSYFGNDGLLIGGINISSKNHPDYQTIINSCVNDANVILNTGEVDYGYFGGIMGFICSYTKNELVIDCINNGNITINNQRTNFSLSGIVGAHAGGGLGHFVGCENNGDLTVAGNDVPYSGAYGEISGICSYANSTFINCSNKGKLSGPAQYIGGICACSSSNTATCGQYVNCTNVGNITTSYEGGVTGDICAKIHSSVSLTVSASNINSLSTKPYKVTLTNAASASGTMIVPNSVGYMTCSTAFGFNRIDLSNNNAGTFTFEISNATFSVIGDNENVAFVVKGSGNTITIDSGTVIGNVKTEGADNVIVNNGTISHLSIRGSSLESINNGLMSSVEFVGEENQTMTFTNNGSIGIATDGWHTVQTQSEINLVFNNNGTIYGRGDKYTLLFYGLSDVTFNAGENSELIIENPDLTAIFWNSESMRANSVIFNIEEGATGVSGSSYYGISSHQTGDTEVLVNIITEVEVSMTWRSGMPYSGNRLVGEPVGLPTSGFYIGADGYTCSTYGISYDSSREYTLKIADDYDDSIHFTLTIVFYNSQTGLITEILSPTHTYDLYGGYSLSHGQSLVLEPTSPNSDGFYVTGFCGTKHSTGNDPLHQEHIATFQNNIQLVSARV